jgi:hypothetical protein
MHPIKWIKKGFLNIAIGTLTEALSKYPMVMEAIDVSNEKGIIGMLQWLADKLGWPYATGTAHDRILELGNHFGEYKGLWQHFWTTLQKKVEKKRRR